MRISQVIKMISNFLKHLVYQKWGTSHLLKPSNATFFSIVKTTITTKKTKQKKKTIKIVHLHFRTWYPNAFLEKKVLKR